MTAFSRIVLEMFYLESYGTLLCHFAVMVFLVGAPPFLLSPLIHSSPLPT